MNSKALFFSGILVLLLVPYQIEANPVSSEQISPKLLHDESNRYIGSDELGREEENLFPLAALEQQSSDAFWNQNYRDAIDDHQVDSALKRILSELLNSSKRYRNRSKKLAPRGCFGVKLDRIGSMSGLGC